MNKLVTSINGGFPLNLDDIRFVQDSIREVIKGISSTCLIKNQRMRILSGCTTSTGPQGQLIYSEGFILLDDEIFYHPGTTFPSVGVFHYFVEITSSYDPAGQKIFQDTQVHDTYELRIIKISRDILPPTSAPLLTPSSYINEYASISINYPTQPPLNGRIASCCKGYDNIVQFDGVCMITNVPEITSNMTLIGTLPEGFRPAITVIFLLNQLSPFTSVTMSINPNGNIKLVDGTLAPIIYFSQFPSYVAVQ